MVISNLADSMAPASESKNFGAGQRVRVGVAWGKGVCQRGTKGGVGVGRGRRTVVGAVLPRCPSRQS